ncbi:MAG: phosphotransferase [Paludibacter sp.]|jgi:aminoglycoside/choline kinase family phosphotransferase|nr:phosphotransferase [Paludibacter sp.]
MQTLKILFKKITGSEPKTCLPLSPTGSNRRYFRLAGETATLIAVDGNSTDENRAFVAIANQFAAKKINAPQVLAVSDDFRYYLQNDLGDTSLFDYIAEGRKTGNFSDSEKAMLKKTISKLPEIQIRGAENFDFSLCYPQTEFNKRSVLWDLNYFKYCFLKTTNVDFQENILEDDFETLADLLLNEPRETFMYRDFQSRNVMIKNGEPYFIDFQGGRKGCLSYDVVSFLWQAKANFSDDLRNELLQSYLDEVKKYIVIDENEFRNNLKYFVLFRILQTLGAYGFRGYFEQKPHFIQSIPQALNNLKVLLQSDFPELRYLTHILTKICETSTQNSKIDQSTEQKLTVNIYSFSYKRGIPADASGNGGGFVFDCRAIHNPGKYAEYKPLTGLDKPVKDFLENDGEILFFLQNVYNLIDTSVKRYIERGFTHLQISFGCTGGQHRSVYAAQKSAEHLANQFGIEVNIIHREILQNYNLNTQK